MNKFKSCWRKQSQLLWNQQGWVYTLVGQEKTTQNNKSETIRYGKWTELIERFSCTVTLSKSLSRTTRWLLPLKTLQAHLGVIYGTVSSGFNSPNPSVIWQPALQTNVIIPYGTKLNTHFINHVTDYTRLCFVVRITTWGKAFRFAGMCTSICYQSADSLSPEPARSFAAEPRVRPCIWRGPAFSLQSEKTHFLFPGRRADDNLIRPWESCGERAGGNLDENKTCNRFARQARVGVFGCVVWASASAESSCQWLRGSASKSTQDATKLLVIQLSLKPFVLPLFLLLLVLL